MYDWQPKTRWTNWQLYIRWPHSASSPFPSVCSTSHHWMQIKAKQALFKSPLSLPGVTVLSHSAVSDHCSPGAGAPCTAAGTCSTSCGRTSAAWSAFAWCSINRTAVRASGPNVWRSTDTNRTNKSEQEKKEHGGKKRLNNELWFMNSYFSTSPPSCGCSL